jgi:hypothetical protein
MNKFKAFFIIASFAAFGVSAQAANYYVDSDSGNDSNSGLAPDQAWKTLDVVNGKSFQPGNQILFKAGTHYAGQLALKGSGAMIDGKAQPIVVGKYGDGPKPRIDGQGQALDTLLLRNADYWEIRDLEITNHGASAVPERTGVRILCEDYGTMHGIHINGLFVHDVNGDLDKRREGCGIFFEARGGNDSCFDDLTIENCHIVHTDRNGICQRTLGRTRSTHVAIRGNLLEDIGGDGIKLWGSDGGIVEHNVLRGGRMRCADAAAGMWPYASDHCIFQFNEVSGMKGTLDGEAFDSDYICHGNIFQYNYSHDNDGGFMLICAPGNSYCQGTIIRYNISQNDGMHTSRIFHFGGNSSDTLVYNNLIFVSAKQDVPLLNFTEWSGGSAHNTSFFNNIFYVEGSVGYKWGTSVDNIFDNNIFYGHHVSPPKDDHAITTRPALANPGAGSDGIDSLAGYKWQANAIVPRGHLVPDNGGRDFFGNAVPADRAPCVGVEERN